MKPQVAVLGEAVFDFVGIGEAADFRFQGFPGGSPLNTALASQRYGTQAAVCTQLSSDLFGDGLLAHLRANGVDTAYVTRHPRASSLAFVVESGGDAHFQFIGDGSADRYYDPQPRPELPADLRFLSLSPLTSFTEPAHTANVDIITAHRDRATILLDPTVRPALFSDPAQWQRLFDELLPLVHVVKGSDQDFAWLHPDRTPQQSAEHWLTRGPHAVIVTCGGDGADLYRPGHAPLHIEAPRVVVVDTVGAGDTFSGTLMAQLAASGHGGDDVRTYGDALWTSVLGRCAAAAAVNCSRRGCDPPTSAEVDTFLQAGA